MSYGSRVHVKIFAVTLSALAVLWGGVFVWADRQRDEAIAAKLDVLTQISSGVAEHSRGLFKLAELALNAGQRQIAGLPRSANFDAWLAPLADDLREASGDLLVLRLVSPEGMMRRLPVGDLNGRREVEPVDVGASWYEGLRDDVLVGSPIFGPLSNEWVLPLKTRSGSLSGDPYPIAALRLERLAALHDKQRDPRNAIGLARFDGLVLGRSPFDPKRLGTSLAGTSAYREVIAGWDLSKRLKPTVGLDGVERLVGVVRMGDFPAFVYAAAPMDDVMEPVRRRRLVAMGIVGVISVAGLFGAFLLARNLDDIAESHRRFADFAEAASDLVWEMDRDGRFTFLSAQVGRVLGVEGEWMWGLTLEESGWRPTGERSERRFRDAWAMGEAFSDVWFRRVDGVRAGQVITMSGRPFVRAGALAGYRGVISDISVRVRREEERRELAEHRAQAGKMEALGQLAGGIAHDFNNLLGTILGFGQFLVKDFPEGTPQHRFAERIVLASQRGQSMVQQIVTFSRRAPGEPTAMLVADLVNETVELLKAAVPSTTRLVVDDDGGDLAILGDHGRMCQVLLNLGVNASDALENGGEVRITVAAIDVSPSEASAAHGPQGVDQGGSVRQSDRDGHAELRVGVPATGPSVSISVADTGCGIAPEHLDRLFELFFTTKVSHGGSGMGLAVVRRVVTEAGGAIVVRTKPGVGSVFEVILPRIELPAPSIHALESSPSPSDRRRARVLLVDDDDDFRDMALTALERIGHVVVATNSPRRALDAMAKEPSSWDILVTDQTMPGMKGVELVRRAKQLNPAILCVICTGYSSTLGEAEALALGADGFRTKPLDVDNLGRLLDRLLRRRGENPPEDAPEHASEGGA